MSRKYLYAGNQSIRRDNHAQASMGKFFSSWSPSNDDDEPSQMASIPKTSHATSTTKSRRVAVDSRNYVPIYLEQFRKLSDGSFVCRQYHGGRCIFTINCTTSTMKNGHNLARASSLGRLSLSQNKVLTST